MTVAELSIVDGMIGSNVVNKARLSRPPIVGMNERLVRERAILGISGFMELLFVRLTKEERRGMERGILMSDF